MKTNHFLFAFLGALLLGCNVQSIQEEITETVPEGQSVTVSLSLGGEITVQESPLSRASGSETSSLDLYGINVYFDKEKDGNIDDAYAYGLFDNVDDMVITLITGYKYKFICTMIPGGKTVCQTSSSNLYSYPFIVRGSSITCSNAFIAGNEMDLIKDYRGLYFGYTYKKGYLADRYYGETSDYLPKEGGKVIINMKRCVYGLTVNVTGVTKGGVGISINEDPFSENGITYYAYSGFFSTTVYASEDCVKTFEPISFGNVHTCWETGEYSVLIPIKVQWSYTYDGTNVKEEFTKYQAVTIKRNTMTTININLNIDTNDQSENGVQLAMDNTTMGRQDYNFSYDIQLSNTVDNPINPQ